MTEFMFDVPEEEEVLLAEGDTPEPEEELLLTPSSNLNDRERSVIASQLAVATTPGIGTDEAIPAAEEQYLGIYTNLEQGGIQNFKRQLAEQQTMESMSIFEMEARDAIERGEDFSDSIKLTLQYNMQEAAKQEEVAIEEAFAERMIDLLASDPANAELVQDLIEYNEKGQVFDRLVDMNKRSMTIERMISEVFEEEQKQSMFMIAFENVASFLPLREWYQLFNLDSSDSSEQGQMARNLNDTIYTTEDFPAFISDFRKKLEDTSALIGINEDQMLDTLLSLKSVSESEVFANDIWGYVDATDVGFFGVGLIKGVATKAMMLSRFRQRKAADKVILDTLLGAEGEGHSLLRETDRVFGVEGTLPSATRVVDPLGNADVSNSLGVAASSNDELAQRIIDSVAKDERILDVDRPAAVEAALLEMRDTYGPSVVNDFRPFSKDGVTKVSVAIGKEDGSGFATVEEAVEAIKRRRLPEDAETFTDSSGQTFIRVTRDIDEDFIISGQEFLESGSGPIAMFMKSPASVLPDWVQARAEGAGALKGAYVKSMQPIIKTITGLKKAQYKRLQRVLIDGNLEAKWYDRSEFDAKYSNGDNTLPTDEAWKAYRAFINLNDIDWAFRNNELYVLKFSQGYVTGSIDLPNFKHNRIDMKEVPEVRDTARLMLYDKDSGSVLSGRAVNATDLQDKINKGTHKLYTLDSQYALTDKSGYANAILVKNGDVNPGQLKYRQLPKREGGHRGPDGNWFVKQGRVNIIDRTSYVMNPLTHAVGRTRSSLVEYVDRMNKALEAYNNLGPDADSILRRLGFEDGFKEFDDKVKGGTIDKDHKFTIVEGDENPVPNKYGLEEVDIRNVDSFTSYVETQGKPYYGRRGDQPLRGPDDEIAKVIDPMRLLQKSLADSLHRGNLANYRAVATKAWMNTYGKLLRPDNGMSKDQFMITRKKLTEADFDPNAKKSFVRAAMQSHSAMQLQLSSYNDYGRWLAGGITRAARWMDGKGKYSDAISGKLMDWRHADPVVAMRSLAYNVHLGLFQLDQLFVQSQTAVSIAAMDPVKAPQHLYRGFMFQQMNWVTSDDALNAMAKNFDDPADFKEMVRIGRERGIIDLFGDMGDLDHDRLFNVGGPISPSNVMKYGRSIVMAAERFNKSVGYAKAWDELRQTVSLADMRKADNMNQLANLASKYSMNMSNASAARFQKGILGLPTQFLTYPIRLVENVFFNRQFSAGEKVRLAVTQAVLYGSAGIAPMSAGTVDSVLEAFGLDPEENRDAFAAARGGMLDWLLTSWFGSEISHRVGVARGFNDLGRRILGEDIGDTSFLDMVLGPAGTMFKDVLISSSVEAPSIMMDSIRAERSGLFVDWFVDNVQSFAVEHIASLNDVWKAYWIMETGEYLSSRNAKDLIQGMDHTQALAVMLGMTPSKMRDAIRMKERTDAYNKSVTELGETITRLHIEETRHLRNYWATGNEEYKQEMIRVMNLKNMHLGGIRDEQVKQDILNRAVRKADGDWFGLIEKQFNSKFRSLGE